MIRDSTQFYSLSPDEVKKMKRILFSALSVLIFLPINFAQTPTPTPIEDNGDVVKISTNLVQIDVTVTDKKGNPVTDLKAGDFELYENGVRQDITNLSFVSSETDAEMNTVTGTENYDISSSTAPPKTIKPEEVRRTIAFVIDDLALSFESVHHVKRTLKNFVDNQMQPGDLVAIVRTGSGIGALQQFTTDKRRLYAAIDKLKWNSLSKGGTGVFRPFSVALGDLDTTTDPKDIPISEGDLDDYRKNHYGLITIGAIQYVIDGMDRLPGRKSMMLMSDGFQIFTAGRSGLPESSQTLFGLNRLVETANRAGVVIYTMDPRGSQSLDFTEADDLGSRPIKDPVKGTRRVTLKDLEILASRRRTEFKASQDGIYFLAKETGGLAIFNTNDLKGGVEKMLSDQSYYMIGYIPDDESFDPEKKRFNKLEIKVNRPGLEVRYRSGFFGVNDEAIKNPPVNLTNDERIVSALTSPFAVNDINLNLSAIFKGDERENLFVNSYLHIKADDLTFTDGGNGKKKAVFDLLVMNFGDNGVPTDRLSKIFTINVKGQTLEEIMKNGFVYYFTLPVKKPGAYQMRVAVREHSTNKVGSASQFIEIPKLNKDRLTLSGIVVDNVSYDRWNKISGSGEGNTLAGQDDAENDQTAMNDTALRRFKRGSVLRYGLEIYNAKTDVRKRTNLVMQTRLFRDNKMVYEGRETPVNIETQTAVQSIKPAAGAINLASSLAPGDYILQIVITDKLAKKKNQMAAGYVQFELIQ
jgi:VWFA-related protein